jgi:hypothetical protein
MPNKYSHSGVLAQYCKSGFITLPEDLYLAYIRASSVGSLTIQDQQITNSRKSSSEDDPEEYRELNRSCNVSSSNADDPTHHHERGRAGRPTEVPQFPFSHKPNPQDRTALIHSFMSEIDKGIDNESQPDVQDQPQLHNSVDVVQPTEPQRRHGVLTQQSSHAEPSSEINRPHRIDRNAWKSTYPPVSHSGTSSASLAVSASSGDFVLDIPSDFPVHADGVTDTQQKARTGLKDNKLVDGPVAQHDSTLGAHLPQRRSIDGQESRQTSKNVANFPRRSDSLPRSRGNDAKPKVPPRSVNRLTSRQKSELDANTPKTVTRAQRRPISSYASVPNQDDADRRRSSSRSRRKNEHEASEDNSLPPISDSVSETGIEVVDNVALSSDYDNGVKLPEHEAAAIIRLPSSQAALPAGSILRRQASPPPATGSNETRKIHPRRRDLNRPSSAMSSDTQIYAPLSSTFPADSSYTYEPAFIPKSNVVGPGSLAESAIVRAPEPRRERSRPGGSTNELNAPSNNHHEGSYDASASDSSSVGIPSIQPGLPKTSKSSNRHSRHLPVYRDKKQEWLDDPTHNVGHYRSYLLKRDSAGHKRFASGYSTPPGSGQGESSLAQRLNSLPNIITQPKVSEAQEPGDFDVGPLSEASDCTSASSGFYPPDIPRYRDETKTEKEKETAAAAAAAAAAAVKESDRELKREHGAVAVCSLSRSSSSAQSERRKKEKEEKVGRGLLRRLRGVSLSAIR